MNDQPVLRPGDTVVFGKNAESDGPACWTVLMTDSMKKAALIAAVKSPARVSYDVAGTCRNDQKPSWKTCFLRIWLNSSYLGRFSEAERAAIRKTPIPEYEGAGNPVQDRVFILSEGEASLFFENDECRRLADSRKPVCPGDEWQDTCCWWLRAPLIPGPDPGVMQAPFCSETGALGETHDVYDRLFGVRPCLWVDISALELVRDPALESLNVRMLENRRKSLAVFLEGREQVMDVLGEFVDYDLGQSFAILREPSLGTPLVVKTGADFSFRLKPEDKYGPLLNALQMKPYRNVMDMFLRKRDEQTVASWMNQEAWAPTPEYRQPEISDDGKCLVRLGYRYSDSRPMYWRVIKRVSNKILCVAEEGVVLDQMIGCTAEDAFAEASWPTSSIRKWLNGEFLESTFSDNELMRLMCCRTSDGTGSSLAFSDDVFLLSEAEVSVFMPAPRDRLIMGTPSYLDLDAGGIPAGREKAVNPWWLRTQGRKGDWYFSFVDASGEINRDGMPGGSFSCAVRPAILVELTRIDIPFMKKE